MGITPKNPADFDPTMGNYKDLKPFKFWCQKVLPLAYDDSLSYYEVLCKLVDYLNKTMEDVGVLNDDIDALHTAYQQLQSYVNDYFSTLDVQEEINNKLDEFVTDGTFDRILLPLFNAYTVDINAMVDSQNNRIQQQNETISTLQARMDTFSHLTEGSTTGDAELADIRVGANGITYPTAGDAVRAQYNLVNGKISEFLVQSAELQNYLYKKDTIINRSGVEETFNGYDLYKFPVSYGDVFGIRQIDGDEYFFGQLSTNTVVTAVVNNTNIHIPSNSVTDNNYYFYTVELLNTQLKVYGFTGLSNIIVSIKRGNESFISFFKNKRSPILDIPDKVGTDQFVYYLDDVNSLKSSIYKRESGISFIFNTNYYVLTHKVKAGDVVFVSAKPTDISYWGFFTDSTSMESSEMTTQEFVAPSDGIIDTFYKVDEDNYTKVTPHNSVKIDYGCIENVPSSENPYYGKNAVAFGTSLTYRSQTTGGYLAYLPDLSEMTFDNKGVGSSYIYGPTGGLNMLQTIKNYIYYSDKDVVTIEGFVNDWYGEHTLGSYTDTEENSVCGCVRSAINYIRTQNRDATVFLILDHYGTTGSNDCSSTSVRGGKTQYEYYNEIAKVAQSLGVRVIKLYEESEMSEATPQYFIDNIHPTPILGAKQTAYTIWSKMRTTFPNQK